MSHADLKELASIIQDNREIHEDEWMDDEAAKKFWAVQARRCVRVFAQGEALENMLWDHKTDRKTLEVVRDVSNCSHSVWNGTTLSCMLPAVGLFVS